MTGPAACRARRRYLRRPCLAPRLRNASREDDVSAKRLGLPAPLGGLMRMTWRRVVLAHWPLEEPGELEAQLPPGVSLDAFWGRPWKSLVALDAAGPAPLPLLAWPLRRVVSYLQLNLRTYVRGPLGPGIFLLESAVDHRLALAPRLLGLPYELDTCLRLDTRGGALEVRSSRELLHGRIEARPPEPAHPDTLDAFLLERYVVYGLAPDGEPFAVRIEHAPWEVQRASLRSPARGQAEFAHFAPAVRRVRLRELARFQAAAPAGPGARAA